jgi:hypothetical protein
VPTDQVAILKEIAKHEGKKTRPLKLFDPQIGTGARDMFREQAAFEHRGRKLRMWASADFMRVQISGSFAVAACSVNRRSYGVPLEARIPGFPSLPVFASVAGNDCGPLLNSVAFQQALSDLKLKKKESLHTYENAVELYLQRESSEETMSAIATACALADQFPPAGPVRLDLSGLPENFKGLSALIRKWAIADDQERSELIDAASNRELERLVRALLPFFSPIDEYLKSFGTQPLSESAIALGTLAECASEAQRRLSGSGRKLKS